jgi:hypothetical protein
MRGKLQFVLVLITGLVGGWSARAEQSEAPPLNENPIVKNYLDNWTMTWFVANWAEAGFATPQPNQPFRLSDYLEVIKSGVACEGDLCAFMHDAHLFIGLVRSVGYVADQFPCATELTAFVQVPVARTDHGVMCLCMAVEPDDIVGFLRPHKAPDNSPMPSSDPNFVYERRDLHNQFWSFWPTKSAPLRHSAAYDVEKEPSSGTVWSEGDSFLLHGNLGPRTCTRCTYSPGQTLGACRNC